MKFFLVALFALLAFVSATEEVVPEVPYAAGFTLPTKFGNFSVADLSTASSCGTVMGTYKSINAYSNGQYQGTGNSCGGWGNTGLLYQCVEYTQRYFNTKFGTTPVWPVDYAKQMCSNYPKGVKKVSTPAPGNAVVFGWGTYGHTAIVTGVHDGLIDVIEQNASPSGWNTYSQKDASCFLANA
ncbi:CHAP domain-containing protein [archaeon]|nr:MAG: CHAP domain-containing protein [archaeon]